MGAVAVVDPSGTWSRDLIDDRARELGVALADVLSPVDDPDTAVGPRVALLCEAGHGFLVGLLSCWQAGAVAVPLHPGHPIAELSQLADDAGIAAVVCSPAHRLLADRLAGGRPVVEVDDRAAAVEEVGRDRPAEGTAWDQPDERAALMVFTSGTTGRPKGVLHTHGTVRAQVSAILGPWGWSADDQALLVLPLHHVHGIMAVVLCAYAAGAVCEAPGGFDATATWERLGSGEVSVLMAVPTIYTRLIATWEAADDDARARWSAGARRVRLFVSGSAALPASVLARWRDLTGQTLLERYGMTEFGLALSNALDRRVVGHVGFPLPGFEVRLRDDAGDVVAPDRTDEQGELEVRGPAVFARYWRRPEETAAAFTDDGWFRTGDVATLDRDGYRLLGRSSVDIIKTGGEKVSAVEIEEAYRQHPAITDCAVVGLPDDEWGQTVALVAVAAEDVAADALEPATLRAWGKERLAPAKVPVRFEVVDALPRNAMGKVTKPAVVERLLLGP